VKAADVTRSLAPWATLSGMAQCSTLLLPCLLPFPINGFYPPMSHGPTIPTPDPATLPPEDGSNLTGIQLVGLMGVALLAAIIFLDVISG